MSTGDKFSSAWPSGQPIGNDLLLKPSHNHLIILVSFWKMVSDRVYSFRHQNNWYRIILKAPTNSIKEIHLEWAGKLIAMTNSLGNSPLYKHEVSPSSKLHQIEITIIICIWVFLNKNFILAVSCFDIESSLCMWKYPKKQTEHRKGSLTS